MECSGLNDRSYVNILKVDDAKKEITIQS